MTGEIAAIDGRLLRRPRARLWKLAQALAVLGALAGGLLWQGRLEEPKSAPARPVEEFRIVPVRVHLFRSPDAPAVGTTLTRGDMRRIFLKANRIWHAAGVHLWLESVVEAKPSSVEDPHAEVLRSDQLLPLRPRTERAKDRFHIFYVGRMFANGVYMRQDGVFVQQAARLVEVEGGIDEPLPRVTSHELGHGLGLVHRQARTNLMASGTTGTSLNEEEIATAREICGKVDWMPLAPAFLESADRLLKQGKRAEARSRYEAILELPGESEIKERAKRGLSR